MFAGGRTAAATTVGVEDVNISVQEAARRLGISPRFIYRNARELPFIVGIGRRVLCAFAGLPVGTGSEWRCEVLDARPGKVTDWEERNLLG